MNTPDQVRARLRSLSNDDLLHEFGSSHRHISAKEAAHCGGTIPEHEFIGYNVFRLELPFVEAELRRRLAVGVPASHPLQAELPCK